MLEYYSKNVDSLYLGVISSVAAFVLQISLLTVLSFTVQVFSRRLRLRRLYSFSIAEPIDIVNGTDKRIVDGNDDNKMAYVTGPDSIAATRVLLPLTEIFKKARIETYIGKHNMQFQNRNIVSVGGPKYNKCTETIMNTLDIGIEVYFDKDTGILHFNGERFSKESEKMVDYGLIIRCKNPFSQDHKVIILGGCGSFGVLAASSLFEQRIKFRELLKSIRRKRGILSTVLNHDFCIVVKCTVGGNAVANIQLMRLENIKYADHNKLS